MDEVLRTMISVGTLTMAGIKSFAKENKEHRTDRKPTYEAATKLFETKTEVTTKDFTELIGKVPGDRTFRRDCIKYAEKTLNVKIIKLSNPQRWAVEQDIAELATEAITSFTSNGNRLNKDLYAKKMGWSTSLASQVYNEILSDDRYEQVSGGIIREAGA